MKRFLTVAVISALVLPAYAQSQGRRPGAWDSGKMFCALSHSLGKQGSAVFDLRLHSADGNRRPDSADLRAIAGAGGHVLHQFHVAVVRARLDTAALRALLNGQPPLVEVAYPVQDTGRFDVVTQIFFTRPTTVMDDSTLARLGATQPLPWRGRVKLATVADSMIPRIAALAGVSFVRAVSIPCLTWTATAAPKQP